MTNEDWNSVDKLVGKSVEYKRDHYVSKYHWLKENHPEYWGGGNFHYGDWFRDVVKSMNIKTWLDVGCGAGRWCKHVLDNGMSVAVHGVDVVDLGCPEGVLFNTAHARDLPLDDNSFEVVSSWDVFQHLIVDDVDQALAEVFRVASKQVYFIISTTLSYAHRDEIGELHATIKKWDWWFKKMEKYRLGKWSYDNLGSSVFFSVEIV